jgi:uncharacterized membrane protein YheB (UPF0754 family)
MEQQLKEGLDNMCNLSEGIVERTTKRVTESVTESVTTELATKHTIALMDSFSIGVDEAMEKLKVAEKYRESVKAAVEARLAEAQLQIDRLNEYG